jgi:hypothetical protein
LISKNIQFFFPFSKDKEFLSFKVSDSYLDNNEEVLINKQSSSKLVTEQLPNKQSQKVPNYASYQIASKLYSNSKSANFLLFVLGVLISLVVTIKKVIYIYLDEKETIRRNANVKKAAKRYNLKNFISLNNLGILIIYKL